MLKCPICNTENPPESRTCSNCGATLTGVWDLSSTVLDAPTPEPQAVVPPGPREPLTLDIPAPPAPEAPYTPETVAPVPVAPRTPEVPAAPVFKEPPRPENVRVPPPPFPPLPDVARAGLPPATPPPMPVPVPAPAFAYMPAQPYPLVAPRAPRDPMLALLIEAVPAFFGFFGIGWMYAGNTGVGLLWLIVMLMWDALTIGLATATGGLWCCCALPVSLFAIALSVGLLYEHTRHHTTRFS